MLEFASDPGGTTRAGPECEIFRSSNFSWFRLAHLPDALSRHLPALCPLLQDGAADLSDPCVRVVVLPFRQSQLDAVANVRQFPARARVAPGVRWLNDLSRAGPLSF